MVQIPQYIYHYFKLHVKRMGLATLYGKLHIYFEEREYPGETSEEGGEKKEVISIGATECKDIREIHQVPLC